MAVADIAAMTIKEERTLSTDEPAGSSTQADPVELEDRILELCAAHPKGVTDEMIMTDQPSIDTVKRMKALQRLLSMGKVDLLKQGSVLIYRLKTSSTLPSKTKGFEREEKLVYQIIEDSSNKGIWIRDIRLKSNLSNTQINKSLKTLESKKLIKNVKSVAAPKKKVYMLYDLTPDESLTGGAWYSDQEFETEFVDVLNLKCLQFLQQKVHKACTQHRGLVLQRRVSYATVSEVCQFITNLGISKVKLTETNIECILNTLVYDGKVDMTMEAGSNEVIKLYRASQSLIKSPGLSRVPCGVCPCTVFDGISFIESFIIDQCVPGGVVSPSTCIYMKKWLTF